MSTPFTAEAGKFFPNIQEAADWTKTYRKDHPRLAADGTAKKVLYATYFDNAFLQKFMEQPHCVGLRFYQAADSNKERHIIVVGVDADGNDILKVKDSNGQLTGEDGLVGNWGHRCPDYCSTGELAGN